MKYVKLSIIAVALFCFQNAKGQQLYFPASTPLANWANVSPESLGWCTDKIDTLYAFLQNQNTKAFIVLKDGKIVLEKYFGTFTKDSNWYWASAGKSLTSLLIGKAQEEGFFSIQDTSASYLGNGWTSCSLAQEQKITIRNQLNMTTGLDDGVPDNHCLTSSCLKYKADAGTRWAYHNSPYTLLDSVIYKTTGQTMNSYTTAKVKNKIGMNGLWTKIDYDNVFVSTPRSMARFGLLAQNNFIWSSDTLLKDTAYIHAMTNSSQSYNLSYGYLWWLNGKPSYMVPTLQIMIPGSYAPNAPTDMFAGIGKNGQIVSIAKSTGIVVVRMGDAPGDFGEVPTDFCDKIWFNLNKVMCSPISGQFENTSKPILSIYPNPVSTYLNVNMTSTDDSQIQLWNSAGKLIYNQEIFLSRTIDVSHFPQGIYFLKLINKRGLQSETQKVTIIH